MKDYHINIFYSDEDEGYIADIPDLECCSAFGHTPEEALAELEKAKEAWLGAQAGRGQGHSDPRVSACDLPSRFVIIRPPRSDAGWHRAEESQLFATLPITSQRSALWYNPRRMKSGRLLRANSDGNHGSRYSLRFRSEEGHQPRPRCTWQSWSA